MTADRYQPLLELHLVHHPLCPDGDGLGERLFRTLFEDPADLTAHGLRIPVRIWSGDGEDAEAGAPAGPDPDAAEQTVVVVLVDDHFLASPAWTGHLDRLATGAGAGERFLLLPVALSEEALQLQSAAGDVHWIRASGTDGAARQTYIVNRVIHALLGIMRSEPVNVFVSHAKVDGESAAEQIRDFLHRSTTVRDWFDRHDLEPGQRWRDVIRGAASHNLLLAVRSDAYTTREWCRIEVLEAKLHGSPVVVVDALKVGENRSFPYLGNGPAVRWRADPSAKDFEGLLTVMLLETLRFAYFPQRIAHLCRLHARPVPDLVSPCPPELLTVLPEPGTQDASPRVLVYPDPPLGAEELALVKRLVPHISPMTPSALLAGA